MKTLTGWLDISELLEFLYPSQCLGGYLTRVIARSFSPLIVTAFPVLVSVGVGSIRHMLFRKRGESNRPPYGLLVLQGLPWAILLAFCLVPSVSRTVFSVWECETIQLDASTNEDIRFLRDDLSIICDTSDEHKVATYAAAVLVLIWPIGMPLLYFWLVWKCREDIKSGMPTHFARATSFLWREYRVPLYWWEPIEMFKKVVLAGLLLVVVPPPLELLRLLIALLISMAFLVLTLVLRPFNRADNNALSVCSQLATILMYHGAMLIKLDAYYPGLVERSGFKTIFDLTIGMLTVYGVMFALVVGVVAMQVIRTSIERRKMQKGQDVEQVKRAITSMTQTRYPAVFLPFHHFVNFKRMMDYESLRDRGTHTVRALSLAPPSLSLRPLSRLATRLSPFAPSPSSFALTGDRFL